MAVILLALVVPRLYTLTQPAKTLDNSAYKEEAERFAQQLQEAKTKPEGVTVAPASPSAAESNTPTKVAAISIELNKADSMALEALPGIGSVLAKRIVSFRNLLGGFAQVEQLKEVYGLKPETFALVKNNVTVDASLIKGVNINRADAYLLKKHPYFKPHAEAIVTARKQGGTFTSAMDVKNKAGIDDASFKKMKPYIDL